ncbi:CBS domain-containing protein [Rapidithrix thailandica]|uniref:CBS domain-containing protein n=1 Tax=Rapidithrix thailandica TaxID=413964 RepID=UPI003D28C801
MIKEVLTVNTGTEIQEAIALMKQNKIGCLPVIQEKFLVGIITIKDVTEFDYGKDL